MLLRQLYFLINQRTVGLYLPFAYAPVFELIYQYYSFRIKLFKKQKSISYKLLVSFLLVYNLGYDVIYFIVLYYSHNIEILNIEKLKKFKNN